MCMEKAAYGSPSVCVLLTLCNEGVGPPVKVHQSVPFIRPNLCVRHVHEHAQAQAWREVGGGCSRDLEFMALRLPAARSGLCEANKKRKRDKKHRHSMYPPSRS